jgi:hypothetical protein
MFQRGHYSFTVFKQFWECLWLNLNPGQISAFPILTRTVVAHTELIYSQRSDYGLSPLDLREYTGSDRRAVRYARSETGQRRFVPTGQTGSPG